MKELKMNKWADYLVSAVRYAPGSGNRIITYFKVHEDTGNSIAEGRTWNKDELLTALIRGKTFFTIQKDENGKWIKGEEVSISSFKEIFVRSDFKNVPGDYLQNIAEF
jgi:hypothetical protein